MTGSRVLFLWLLLVAVPAAHADGGAVLAREQGGGLSVTVFAAPVPLRVGPIDLSVLVQEARDDTTILDARVLVSLFEEGSGVARWVGPADHEQATNRLLYAAPISIASAGSWRALVEVQKQGAQLSMEVALDVLPALPAARRFWPWLAIPLLVALVFLLHQWLQQRRPRGAAGG